MITGLMITGLLITLVVLEIIRLYLTIKDTQRINKINEHVGDQQAKALEFAERQNAEWKRIREIEIKELKELAKESNTMKEIYDEWVKAHKDLE